MIKKTMLALAALAYCTAALAQSPPPVNKPTYWSGVYNLAVPAAATDVACLENPQGAVVRLLSVTLYGLGSAAGSIDIAVLRRNALNTGGTSTTPAIIASDQQQGPPAAVFRVYTVNPTVGALDGIFALMRWDITTTGSNPDPSGAASLRSVAILPSGILPTLRNANSALCLNFNAPTPSSTITLNMVWNEGP